MSIPAISRGVVLGGEGAHHSGEDKRTIQYEERNGNMRLRLGVHKTADEACVFGIDIRIERQ